LIIWSWLVVAVEDQIMAVVAGLAGLEQALAYLLLLVQHIRLRLEAEVLVEQIQIQVPLEGILFLAPLHLMVAVVVVGRLPMGQMAGLVVVVEGLLLLQQGD
jgi:L-asparagine transporter-like permease